MLGSGENVYAVSSGQMDRLTNKALLEGYLTSEIYLVNSERILVTPTRLIKNVEVKQKVETFPVQECLENGREISGEYDNYLGVRVLGASMCFRNEGIVVITEVAKSEIFAPLTDLNRSTSFIGI
ncbi:MAG: Sensor protein, partial [Candidatus Daviesbacteria bacterium GW2011_GWB1_41_5]